MDKTLQDKKTKILAVDDGISLQALSKLFTIQQLIQLLKAHLE